MSNRLSIIAAVVLTATIGARVGAQSSGPAGSSLTLVCGDHLLEDSRRCTWEANGVSYEARSDGTFTARRGQAPKTVATFSLPARHFLESITFGSVGDDLLVVYGYGDGEGSGTAVTRLDARSLARRWLVLVPAFNGSHTVDGDDLFVAGIGFVSRIDLRTGRFVWKLSGMYDARDFSFNSFEAPKIFGNDVVFIERQGSESPRPNKRITVDRATGKARLDRVVASNGHDSDLATFNRMLGVECTHCHVAGDWKSDANPTLAVARRMRQMVERINRTSLNGIGTVTCWTCHEGKTQPRLLPPASWMAVRDKSFTGALASRPDDVKIRMSVYASSLNVACAYCHVQGDWLNSSKPAFGMVARMNAMVEVFPDYMPASARTQCFMCHKGSTSPRSGK